MAARRNANGVIKLRQSDPLVVEIVVVVAVVVVVGKPLHLSRKIE